MPCNLLSRLQGVKEESHQPFAGTGQTSEPSRELAQLVRRELDDGPLRLVTGRCVRSWRPGGRGRLIVSRFPTRQAPLSAALLASLSVKPCHLRMADGLRLLARAAQEVLLVGFGLPAEYRRSLGNPEGPLVERLAERSLLP